MSEKKNNCNSNCKVIFKHEEEKIKLHIEFQSLKLLSFKRKIHDLFYYYLADLQYCLPINHPFSGHSIHKVHQDSASLANLQSQSVVTGFFGYLFPLNIHRF